VSQSKGTYDCTNIKSYYNKVICYQTDAVLIKIHITVFV